MSDRDMVAIAYLVEAAKQAYDWVEAEFSDSEIELNGALSNVHADLYNALYKFDKTIFIGKEDFSDD